MDTEADAGHHLQELLKGALAEAKADVRMLIIMALVGFAFAWIINIVVVAVVFEGVGKVTPGSAAVSQTNQVGGSIFWFIAAALAFGLVGYFLQVGGRQFWLDLRGFPGSLGQLLRHDADTAFTHLLWGVAGAMLVAVFLSPAFSVLLAFGMLVFVSGALRFLVVGLLMTGWRRLVGALASNRGTPPPELAWAVGLLGSVAGFAVAYALANPGLKLLAALGAAGLALALGRRPGQHPVALLALCAAGVGLLLLGHDLVALAADGGWQENGGDFNAWLNGGGADVISQSITAGVLGGAGATVGSSTGKQLGRDRSRRPFNQAEYDKLMAERIAQHQKEAMDRVTNPDPDTKAFLDKLDQKQRELKALDDKFAEMQKRFKDLSRPPRAVSVPNFDLNTASGRDAALNYLKDNADDMARIQALKQAVAQKLPDLGPGSKIASGPLQDAIHDAEQPHLELQRQAQIDLEKFKQSLTPEQRKAIYGGAGSPKK